MYRFTPIALCLVACAPIRIYTESEQALPMLDEASEILGTRIKVVDAPGPGITTLEIRDSEINPEDGERICGRALERVLHAESVRDALTNGVVDCTPEAWSCATVTFISHELGHVYGLGHVKQTEDRTKKGNFMQPAPGEGRAATQQQQTIVRLHAAGLNEVCRHSEGP